MPGLYESLFYDMFKCNSPKMVCDLLKKYVGNGPAQDDIVALDIGAGNGMVGEHLSAMGSETIVGVDILSEAADALERDRPGLYDAYHVADLTAMALT
ncbi:class I SAM-dependent methyltransferase [Desulfobacter sp.]